MKLLVCFNVADTVADVFDQYRKMSVKSMERDRRQHNESGIFNVDFFHSQSIQSVHISTKMFYI